MQPEQSFPSRRPIRTASGMPGQAAALFPPSPWLASFGHSTSPVCNFCCSPALSRAGGRAGGRRRPANGEPGAGGQLYSPMRRRGADAAPANRAARRKPAGGQEESAGAAPLIYTVAGHGLEGSLATLGLGSASGGGAASGSARRLRRRRRAGAAPGQGWLEISRSGWFAGFPFLLRLSGLRISPGLRSMQQLGQGVGFQGRKIEEGSLVCAAWLLYRKRPGEGEKRGRGVVLDGWLLGRVAWVGDRCDPARVQCWKREGVFLRRVSPAISSAPGHYIAHCGSPACCG